MAAASYDRIGGVVRLDAKVGGAPEHHDRQGNVAVGEQAQLHRFLFGAVALSRVSRSRPAVAALAAAEGQAGTDLLREVQHREREDDGCKDEHVYLVGGEAFRCEVRCWIERADGRAIAMCQWLGAGVSRDTSTIGGLCVGGPHTATDQGHELALRPAIGMISVMLVPKMLVNPHLHTPRTRLHQDMCGLIRRRRPALRAAPGWPGRVQEAKKVAKEEHVVDELGKQPERDVDQLVDLKLSVRDVEAAFQVRQRFLRTHHQK